jgi:hypothetical protein
VDFVNRKLHPCGRRSRWNRKIEKPPSHQKDLRKERQN